MKYRFNIKSVHIIIMLLIVLSLASGQYSFAQSTIVSGYVLESGNKPLAGVTVAVKNSQLKTVTNERGFFSIPNQTKQIILEFTMIGFEAMEKVAEPGKEITITLKETSATLKEVVFVGYGSVTKKEITGAVSIVKGNQISNMPVRSAADVLQGKAAGVTVSQSSGSPGAPSVVRVRGIGSINGSTDPLYVVDGLPQNEINFLNPNDIESIAIHKDASVAAIYGARASNGVVIITTKSGSKNEKATISFDSYIGVQSPWREPEMLNAAEFIEYKQKAAINAGAPLQFDFATKERVDSILSFVSKTTGPNGTDWWAGITNNAAPVQNYNLSVSGGGKLASYLSSLAYMNQEGIIKGSEYERISWRNNLNSQVSKNLKISTNLGIIYEKRLAVDENNPFTGTIFSAMAGDPITPVFRNSLVELPGFLAGIMNGYEPNNSFSQYAGFLYSNKRNPIAQIDRLKQGKFDQISVKGGVTAELRLVQGLMLQSRFGFDVYRGFSLGFIPKYSLNAYDNSNFNQVSNSSYNTNYYVFENTLNYTKTYQNLTLNALAGVSAELTKSSQFGASIQGIVNNDEEMRIINAGTVNPSVFGYPSSSAINSYFGRLSLDYAGRYIISGNIRRDGTSRFADAYRWGTFPSVSAAWRFTEEAFIPEFISANINEGKIRISYGVIGNQNIAGGAYLSTFGNSFGRYLFGNESSPVIGGGRIAAGNSVLRWETSKQLDVGLDVTLLKGRLNLVLDYFDKRVDNMLITVPLPTTLGYPNSPYSNAGSMQNIGYEAELTFNNQIGKLKYSVAANISTYRNKVTKLGNGEPIFTTAHLNQILTKTEVGMPIGFYYGYLTNGIFQNEKEVENSPQRDVSTPGDIRFKDINGDDVINANDRTVIGNPWPDFVYGITTNLSYKNFDLSVFLQGSQGNDVMNIMLYDIESGTGFYNAPKDFLKRSWNGEGSTDRFHKISQKQGLNNSVSDYFVEDGSYLRIRNLQFGYNFSTRLLKRISMSQLRLYAGAQNLFTFTKYSGLDPEIGSADPKKTGIDMGFYPQARTITIGINAKF
ncbi:TonB-dependent receptor [Flavihumibacter rivuli]|uniref:SusC/RagA family TonB-linked outer membrane protein n=1 Tax=Flavihumibacter rivuli TaxID=2838156 RepID=UPI001BDF221A|nr:TonB-dependent receptor [Flavihumibacter rivuli]ULQ55771.1 TonB-dependent receptor [Flavihumibacter rivuli]